MRSGESRAAFVVVSLGALFALQAACGSDGVNNNESTAGPTGSTPEGGTSSEAASSAEGGTPAKPGSGAAFCDATFGKQKTRYESCCTGAEHDRMKQMTFIDLTVARCPIVLEEGIKKARLAADDAAMATCAADYEKLLAGPGGCDRYNVVNHSQGFGIPSSCRGALVGLVPEGGACGFHYECRTGLTCIGAKSSLAEGVTTDGVCTKPAAAGGTCAATAELFGFGDHPTCAADAYCTSDGKCLARLADDATCGFDDQCASDYCFSGKCKKGPHATVGGACGDPGDCEFGLRCDEVTSKCAPKKAAGEACGAPGTDSEACRGQCIKDDAGTSGTCASFCSSG